MRREHVFGIRAVLGAGLAVVLEAAPSIAQAWLPPKGEASLTLGYNRMWATHHVDYQGNPSSPGDMIWNNVGIDLSYGVTDRLAVRVGLPFVTSKYDGAFPHAPLAGRVAEDDGEWHSRFQDVTTELRYRVTTGSLAITPFVGLVVPTHSYPSYGHGSAGKDLVEGRFGLTVGRLLDPLLPDAYFQLRYAYTVPEQALGIAHNASQLTLDLGYLMGSSLTLRAIGAFQKTHGGWRAMIDFPARTNPGFVMHDRLQRTDYFRLGGSVAYSITNSLDVNLFGYSTIVARSDINMSSLGVALTWSASPAQLIRKGRAAGESR